MMYNLMLSIDGMRVIKCYLETSFAVHLYFKSHTGGMMMWVTGVTQSRLTKKNLNTRSSTEVEVFGVDNMASKSFGHNCLLRIKDTMWKFIFVTR